MSQTPPRSPLADLWASISLGPVIKVAADTDERFLRALFFMVKAEDFAPLGLLAPILDMMLDQQFRAQRQGYAQMFPEAETCLILSAGEPVGRMMITCIGDDRLHLIDIALRGDARGKGLGTHVLGALIAAARAGGYRRLTLTVSAINTAAARLYGRLGFQVVGIIDTELASHTMELTL